MSAEQPASARRRIEESARSSERLGKPTGAPEIAGIYIRARGLDAVPLALDAEPEGRRARPPAAEAGAQGAGRQRARCRRHGARRASSRTAAGTSRTTDRGFAGDPADIARLFSIRRPLVSSKLLRLPTRGALGNGLRVVAGAVLASDGRLVLETRGRRLDLRPQDNGDTLATFEPCARTTGTRIEIQPGRRTERLRCAGVGEERCRARAGWARSIEADRRRTGTTARRSSICSRRPGAAACASWWPSSTAAPAPRRARSRPPSRAAPAAA